MTDVRGLGAPDIDSGLQQLVSATMDLWAQMLDRCHPSLGDHSSCTATASSAVVTVPLRYHVKTAPCDTDIDLAVPLRPGLFGYSNR
jgi:hypothetical protein